MQKKSGFPVSQEPHQFQQQLLKAGALQSAIFSSANFSCIATDDQGVIQIFNVGAERMLGYKAEEVVDRVTPIRFTDANELLTRAAALSQELGTTIASGVEALVSKAVHGIEDVFELTCIRKDGSRFPVVLSVTALRDPQQNVIGYLLIATDNTARKQDEAKQILLDQRLREQQHALQETNVELEMAKLAAEKANRAKSDFLSSMSHELRTPLNAVLGFAQLMESETPSPTPAQKLSIEQILKGGWYLLHLINEILDLATIESGKVTMSLEAVSLAEVLLDCQTIIESQATRREVKIAFPPVDSLFYVHADRTRVKQVMINLLSNAIKYNRVGGTVIVKCEMRGKNNLRISVSDTGLGLRPEQVTQLFQPFNRLGQESSAEEGTGIGLVVTKQLIELMGGAIGVESTADVGSEFWVELPASGPPQVVFDKASKAQLDEPINVAMQDVSIQRTVLYVEDNPANLALVEQLITRRDDLNMLTAIDGYQGIDLARIHRPHIILMDINLPGIGGFDALEILRTDPATSHIPVMALSANAVPRDIEKGLDAGFFRYLTKPIKFTEFIDAIDAALHHAAIKGDANECEEK